MDAKDNFISPSRGPRDFDGVIDDIVEFVEEDENRQYSIVVGTDSTVSAPTPAGRGPDRSVGAEFVSVVAVHRIGKHGRYFWKRIRGIPVYDRHDRMLKEASFSLDLAQRVVNDLRARLEDHLYNFEIHLDIGENGPTKTLIQEIVGMITGNGFVARIKPESYAANKVADRHIG